MKSSASRSSILHNVGLSFLLLAAAVAVSQLSPQLRFPQTASASSWLEVSDAAAAKGRMTDLAKAVYAEYYHPYLPEAKARRAAALRGELAMLAAMTALASAIRWDMPADCRPTLPWSPQLPAELAGAPEAGLLLAWRKAILLDASLRNPMIPDPSVKPYKTTVTKKTTGKWYGTRKLVMSPALVEAQKRPIRAADFPFGDVIQARVSLFAGDIALDQAKAVYIRNRRWTFSAALLAAIQYKGRKSAKARQWVLDEARLLLRSRGSSAFWSRACRSILSEEAVKSLAPVA